MTARAKRFPARGAVFVLALCSLVLLAAQIARLSLARETRAPGKLVDLGGYKSHLRCVGSGAPTVVLEAGLNDFSSHWGRVQVALERRFRTCSYDRAGLGFSDPSPRPRVPAEMAGELRRVLALAGERGPFILVGHSFGGLLVREFARAHPTDVAGIVLVDSAHEDQFRKLPRLAPAVRHAVTLFRNLSWLDRLGVIALFSSAVPARKLEGQPLAEYRAVLATRDYFTGAALETEAFMRYLETSERGGSESLGDLPLIVLSRGLAESLPGSNDEQTADERAWQELQIDLARLSSQSKRLVATKSGHYIQLDEPELLVEAVGGIDALQVTRARIPPLPRALAANESLPNELPDIEEVLQLSKLGSNRCSIGPRGPEHELPDLWGNRLHR